MAVRCNLYLLLTIIFIAGETSCYKILLPLPLCSSLTKSDCFTLRSVSSALAQRGHSFHIVRSSEKACENNLDEFLASDVIDYNLQRDNVTDVELLALKFANSHRVLDKLVYYTYMQKFYADRCRYILKNADLLADMRQRNFDAILADMFTPCYALLANRLQIPLVGLTTSREYFSFRIRSFGFPSELSYVPEYGSGLTSDLTFIQRLQNVAWGLMSRVFPLIFLREFRNIQEEFNIEPKASLDTIMSRSKLWLSYSTLALDYPEPEMPNWIPISGIAFDETHHTLSQDLDDFVQGSGEYGVIIFSLGSTIGSFPDAQTTLMIARVFSRLPQRVVWRHTDVKPNNLGNNTMIVEWMPQNVLLGHPKTRLFIGHGGLNGVYEALYNAVPMILIPLMASDQWDNAARVVSKGMGLHLDSLTINEDTFYNAVTEVLQDQKYKDNVSYYSAILRDLPPAKDRAVFWIEHVLKFGDKHLRAKVFELNLIQYYLLDVAAFFLLTVVVVVMFMRFTCRLCCYACRGGAKKKVD